MKARTNLQMVTLEYLNNEWGYKKNYIICSAKVDKFVLVTDYEKNIAILQNMTKLVTLHSTLTTF